VAAPTLKRNISDRNRVKELEFLSVLEVVMNRAGPLRAALLANALFATICAMFMILGTGAVGTLLGVEAPLVIRGIGFGLVLFAADLIHQATRPRMATWRALYASVADFLWVLGTLVGIVLFPAALSTSGLVTVLAVAGIVFAFGIWQLVGIRVAHGAGDPTMYRHCIVVRVDADADAMWSVIQRLGDIQKYMPTLRSSVVLDGKAPGVGAIRRCVDTAGRSWSEECTEYRPGSGFVVRFHADAPGFPFPATAMVGGWEVTPQDDGANVMVWWEIQPKPRWLATAILPLLAFKVDRDFPQVIERMARDAIGSPGNESSDVRPVARLMPQLC
jgi:hypothetical protein